MAHPQPVKGGQGFNGRPHLVLTNTLVVPEGRLMAGRSRSIVPPGLQFGVVEPLSPSDESLGYYRTSLRDRNRGDSGHVVLRSGLWCGLPTIDTAISCSP